MAASGLLARKVILSVAQNRAVHKLATRHGMRLGASRFVAGEDLQSALTAVAELNRSGIWGTLDHVGEFVADPAEARASAGACVAALDGIQQSGVRCNLSLKLTQLGLDIDPALCRENLRRIVSRAAEYDNFVRVDMEDSPRTDRTLQLVAKMRDEFGPERIGTVIQGYLFRSSSDLLALAEHNTNVRLVKGAYMEPPTVAFPSKADVDANYQKLIEQYLGAGVYTAVATHDERVIRATQAFVQQHNIDRSRFEFQMLYGIRRDLQRQLAAEGYRMRVYIPYGTDWYGYFTRRLAERPANVMFVLGNLFKR